MATAKDNSLTKPQKAALVLMAMDQKTSSTLFEKMEDDEVNAIGQAMLDLEHIPQEQLATVMQEFLKNYQGQYEKLHGGDLFIEGEKAAQSFLSRTLGNSRSQKILTGLKDPRSLAPKAEANFTELLSGAQPDKVFELIQKEHPQVIALVLNSAPQKSAKEILALFDEKLQVDLIKRMASLDKVSARTLKDLQGYLGEKLVEELGQDQGGGDDLGGETEIEGLEDTVRVLKTLPKTQALTILEQIEEQDPDLGEAISKLMLTLEDLIHAQDQGMRELLRGITNDDLKVALKDSPKAIQDKFFGNMSERAAMILREDMEVMDALKIEEIEKAQSNILKVAKELMKQNKLNIEEGEGE